MQELIHQLEWYLQEILGITVTPRPWEGSVGLPLYVRDGYSFFKISLLGSDIILMIDTREGEQTPAVIRKQLDQVRSKQQVEPVYVREAVSSHNRKRLIEQRVPFIVPGNQMYLPMLGIDLREHFKGLREARPTFSPATQALILYAILKKENEMTPSDIAIDLNRSAMTMTRTFDELKTAGIGEHSMKGKERLLRFSEVGKKLWETALPYLTTPVNRRLYVDSDMTIGAGCQAGENALTGYTMLAEPWIPAYAFSSSDWKARIEQGDIVQLNNSEPLCYEIEVWSYSPLIFVDKGKPVDRLSLYLSLKDSTDERIQSALDELLEGMKW